MYFVCDITLNNECWSSYRTCVPSRDATTVGTTWLCQLGDGRTKICMHQLKGRCKIHCTYIHTYIYIERDR